MADMKPVTLTTPRETFLAERLTGLGGSDAASVFGIGWGCRRRLFYEKRGIEPDYPRPETAAMELGVILEPYFREKYEKETGREVVANIYDRASLHADFPELMVHPDGLVRESNGEMNRVLEIKTVGRAVFYNIKRSGLPEDYVLQLQWSMTVTGAPAGAFAVGSRDSGELLHWDVPANPELHKAILEEGPKFWALVQNGPMPEALEPEDKRCQNCSWRLTCHGNAFIPTAADSEYETDESLAPLVREYIERRALVKEADELLDEVKSELQSKLGDRGKVTAAGAKIQYYQITKKEYVVKEHTERALRLYPAKEKK